MATIWFVLCFISLYSSIFLIKKNEEKQNGITWGLMVFVIVLCCQALSAALINLIKIPVNLWNIGITNAICGLFLWRRLVKQKQTQAYYWRKADVIAVILIAIPVIVAVIEQFGLGLKLNYSSVDAITHFRMAIEVLQNQKVERMFFAPLNNALFLGIFSPFVKSTQLYHVFIFSDIFMYYIAGLVFYCVLSDEIRSKWDWGIALLVSLCYMLGYPRNNLLFGFNYWGIAIILILFLVWATKFYIEDSINRNLSVILMSLGCYSLGVCYSLFAPILFFSVCATVSVQIWRQRVSGDNQWVKVFFVDNLRIFLIPCILVFIYSFVGFFGIQNSGEAVGEGISREGAIYRDLFSNFIFWIPFVILGIYKSIQKKINDVMVFCAGFMMIFLIFLGIQGMQLKVSSYYFYKNYFLVSVIVFYFSFLGIKDLMKSSKAFVLASLGVFILLAIGTVCNFEEKIQRKNVLFAPSNKSQYFFDIYVVNQQIIKGLEEYSKDKLELYEYFNEYFPQSSYDSIIVCSCVEDYNLFSSMTQRIDKKKCIYLERLTEEEKKATFKDNIKFEELYRKMQDNPNLKSVMPLLFVYTTEADFEEFMRFKGDNVEILYENSMGIIGIMEKCKE